jgi:hypothetical protein
MPTYTKTKIDSTTVLIEVREGSASGDTAQIPVHTMIWKNFKAVTTAQKAKAQQAAKDKWGVTPNDWYIYRTSNMEQYSPIYGFISESAQRHALSPEFLHAVVMGEGLHLFIEQQRKAGTPYQASTAIDAYQYLGTDAIGSSIDELIRDGYIDKSHKTNISPKKVVNELGEEKVSAVVAGYETAVEAVAAELHWRKDWILSYISRNALKVDTADSDVVDFLTYATYNRMTVGTEAAKNTAHYMRKYSGTERTDQMNVRFNTLKRLCVSDWYKAVKVYVVK